MKQTDLIEPIELVELIELGNCLNIEKNDVVSIVGAGGKTSLIMYLARYLKGQKVISASTKMYRPKGNWSCYIDQPYSWCGEEEIIVASKTMIQQKIAGLNPYTVESGFDYWLIEADGSKKLPLKGWGPNEPVIAEETTVTVGIVDITTIGMTVNEDTVFRVDEFKAMTEVKDSVTIQSLVDIIVHKNGLFKNSKGRRILMVNKAETKGSFNQSEQLCERLMTCHPLHGIDEVIIGSVMNQKGYLRGIL